MEKKIAKVREKGSVRRGSNAHYRGEKYRAQTNLDSR